MSEATFKSIILEKKRQMFESHKANAFEDAICIDCSKSGHYTKAYFKCKFYVADTANTVGSSSGKKRKQNYEDIAQKQQAKRQKDQVEGDVAICSKCKQRGHRSARSLLRPQGILSKAQAIRANLGDNYKAYTRKLGFDNCVSDTYHTKLQSSVIKACSTVRHLVFRAKLFVNYYVLENHALIGAPKVIFSQNFWYSIIQMVNGKRPTNSVSLPQQLLSSFDQLKRQHRSILYTEKLLPGISQCVTEACTELATSYTNNIVENFENHLLYFLRYKLQDLFMFMPKKIIGEVAKKYCYQEISQLEMFFRIFKFEKLRFKEITELAPNGNNSILFSNIVRTDGVSVAFLFYRKHQADPSPSYQRFDLALEDFDLSEVKDKYLPKSLDPGRTSVFTATVGLQSNRHLRCTTKEYYHMTGLTRFSRKQNKLKKDTGIESLEIIDNPSKPKKQKWKPALYLESKTKIPLIVFGAGMFGKDAVKLKGHRCGIVGKLFRTLKRREAEGRLIVTTIDEFKTSKTCNLCLSDGLTIIDTDNFKGVGVVCCHHCKQLWQRDINASNNMMTISKAVWSGQGRPQVFTPERNTSP
ncbi:hypothetical protein MFLAVUS_002818 [Mucor flavus]|uniref:Cas12f1-like TNB domain-containing protein n=1 Tax=Mucor flavus TaxID=439312 RepID=A0ABP9YRC1_9FUNG